MADDIEVEIEESNEPPECLYCGLIMEDEEYVEWKKENKNIGVFVCSSCEDLSHFEKSVLMQLRNLHSAINDVAERVMNKEDMEKEKARQTQKTMAGYMEK